MSRANGSLLILDPNAARAIEADTATCSHCQKVIVLHDVSGRKIDNVAVWCGGCGKLACVACMETGRCEPFEKKLEAIEGRRGFFAAMGI